MAEDNKPLAVVHGKASGTNKSLWKKLTETFTIGNMKDTRNYIISDVIVPGFLDMLYDGITRGAGKLIYGEKGSPHRGSKKGTDYSSGIKRLSDGESWGRSVVKHKESSISDIYDYNEIELRTAADANILLDNMCEYLSIHDIISVANMYDMADYRGGDYTDNYWGWDSLAGARVTRSSDGWILKLPPVKNIKDIK